MTSGKINERVVVQRVLWIKQMRDAIKDLPIQDKDEFLRNPHNVAAAEYKEIADGLFEKKILARKDADLLRQMAGYRNRMVHFYHEISPEELFDICAYHLDEIQVLSHRLVTRLRLSPKK